MRQVGAVVSFVALALLFSQHAVLGQSQPSTTPPAPIGAPGAPYHLSSGALPHGQLLRVRTDEQSPPGCLAITGKPVPPTCEPCPPLWLGGPTIRCITLLRFKEESRGWALASYYAGEALVSGTGSTHPGATRTLWGTGWLAACPGVPTLPKQWLSARLGAWICGSGFMTRP